MADRTAIEWTDATWNPIVGCSVVSPGCTNCYAMRLAGTRLRHHPSRQGLTEPSKAGPVWNGQVRLLEAKLTEPLRWRRPRRIFVCAHGDLFHEAVPDAWIDRVFAVMALAPQHTFQVLTKRPERALEYFGGGPGPGWGARNNRVTAVARSLHPSLPEHWTAIGAGRLDHIWFGASAEDQQRWEERRWPLLSLGSHFGAAFLSAEPLLGLIDLDFRWDHCDLCGGTGILARWPKGKCHICGGKGKMLINGVPWRHGYLRLDWIIAGGESGPGARPMHPDWPRALRDQCAAAGVPFFFKQWGEWGPTSGVDVYCHGPNKNRRQFPNSDGISWLADGRICYRDFSVAEHQRRIRAGSAYNTRAVEVDEAAIADLTASFREDNRPSDNPFGYQWMYRVGKKTAGRLLDGRTHDAMPDLANR